MLAIEKKLKLIDAFCTESVKLPACSSKAYPTCTTVMPRSVTEAVIGALIDSDIVFVADSAATVHVFVRKTTAFVTFASLQLPAACGSGSPVSLVRIQCMPLYEVFHRPTSNELRTALRRALAVHFQTATRSGLLLRK